MTNPRSRSQDGWGRVPPHSLDAERSVLGSMMIEQEAIPIAAATLLPRDFYRETHGVIFGAMIALSDRDEPVDLVTLSGELTKLGKLEAVGGVACLTELASGVPTAAHVERYAQMVRDHSLARQLIRTATEIVARGFDGGVEIQDLLNEADARIAALQSGAARAQVARASDIFRELMTAVYAQGDNAPPPLRFGLGVDKTWDGIEWSGVWDGFLPGTLNILAGRTSVGKTFVTLHIARQCAMVMRRPVLIVSLEMTRNKVVDRMFGALAGMNHSKLQSQRTWQVADKARVQYATEALLTAPIYITTDHRTSAQIRAAASGIKRREGLGLVVIDYLELVDDAIAGEKRDALGKMAQRFRNLAMDLDVPVLLVHQLNRAPDARQDKRPFLSDLRDSGHLENAADGVILLYRPGYYDRNADQSELEIIVAKQRDEDVGMARVRLDRTTGLLSDFDSEPFPTA